MDEKSVQEKRRANEELATARRAHLLELPYFDARPYEQKLPLVQNVLDPKTMRQNSIIPFRKGDNAAPYQFLITSQTPSHIISQMTREYNNDGYNIDFFLISKSAYQVLIERYDPPPSIHYDDIKISKEGDSKTITEVSHTLDSVASNQVFDFLLDQADKLGASDIHIENLRTKIRVRMRVDGLLHPVANLNRDRYRVIVDELASRANISSAAQKPQSGHIQKEVTTPNGQHLLNIRVETVPTMYGQDAVLRLFNFDESLLNLDLLGLNKIERTQIDDIVSHPRGLVLMVGPTGSGKSTTLYSIINALNTTERKIITLEDPIEYGINGISQIPINTNQGSSFAEGLRSILRLDPDVVMVGEIRDADTARTAIQASITGHLVLSSFHANSTSAAFSRMIDLIGTNPIFSSSIRLVMAQRLVRKLTDNKQPYEPDESTKKYIRETLAGVPDTALKDINLKKITLYKAQPDKQNPFGYQGRTMIMEQLIVSEKIQAFIRGDISDINTENIEKTAREDGMLTLEQKGILAALRGETTLAEISRVI